ncbi:MAG: hypothetical protein K5664_00075, partial [Firmicutes bacterium]|nr:hypothetical protein [Bacillota bacterium]
LKFDSSVDRTRTPQTRINTGKGSSPPVTESKYYRLKTNVTKKSVRVRVQGLEPKSQKTA